ncbi:hypothetical protein NPIL_526521 [Nephila pilipes]|uniref:YqaJ viral recombinase domain-containing protein n=1 Tax=Nephila pilipes TaxID=299642 RepID=A0A8X6NAR8_NEPPI|nr:hypothetical protein NPIL_526521 [Nephila pilipes]
MHITETFFFHQHFFKSIEELVEIEQRTVGQNCTHTDCEYRLEMEDRVWSMVQHMYPQCIVRKNGLVIHPLDQYIAASPDGLIRSGEDYMLLEIKCILNPDGSSPEVINK